MNHRARKLIEEAEKKHKNINLSVMRKGGEPEPTEWASRYERIRALTGLTVAEFEAAMGLPLFTCYPHFESARTLFDMGRFAYCGPSEEEIQAEKDRRGHAAHAALLKKRTEEGFVRKAKAPKKKHTPIPGRPGKPVFVPRSFAPYGEH